MVNNKLNEFFNRILFYHLAISVFLSVVVFLFHISPKGILFALLPVAVKLILFLGKNNILNIEEETEDKIIIMKLCLLTLFFTADGIVFNNFVSFPTCFIIPVLLITLLKDNKIIIQECVITSIYVMLILIFSSFVTLFQPNILTNLLFFLCAIFQIFLIIKKFTDETLSISAKSDFFMDKSRRDVMTGLYNSSTFYDMVAEKTQLMAPFCVVIFNIDNFKNVKDAYGQPFGEFVIKTLVNTIKNNCREQDIAFRYAGEDLAVIFPRTTEDTAYMITEKIRKSFAQTAYNHNTDWVRTRKPITTSVGLIENNKRGTMAQEIIEKCDKALFYSKQNGKNQTTIYHDHIVEWEDKFEDYRRKYRDFER